MASFENGIPVFEVAVGLGLKLTSDVADERSSLWKEEIGSAETMIRGRVVGGEAIVELATGELGNELVRLLEESLELILLVDESSSPVPGEAKILGTEVPVNHTIAGVFVSASPKTSGVAEGGCIFKSWQLGCRAVSIDVCANEGVTLMPHDSGLRISGVGTS